MQLFEPHVRGLFVAIADSFERIHSSQAHLTGRTHQKGELPGTSKIINNKIMERARNMTVTMVGLEQENRSISGRLTISAVFAETLRLRANDGDSLAAPRTTAAEAAKLQPAAFNPSIVA